MRILLVTSMVPDAAGIGAMPKLFQAQLDGLSEHHQVTLVAGYGDEPGQAEAAARLLRSGVEARFADRRRSPTPRRRWRVRGELAYAWLTEGWPWRVVSGAGGLQVLIDDATRKRRFDVVAVEDNPAAMLRFPAGVPRVLTEHEAVRAPASEWRAVRFSERPLRALRAADWRRWERFLKSAWQRFDLLQVYCEGDAAAVRRAAPELGERIRVNPYGIILPPRLDPEEEKPGTILFSGTFGHLPNRDAARWLATEIMPAIRARAPQARLCILGSAPPREILELAGPGIEVIANPASMEPHLRAAALVLAPVRSGGGMRMKVLEALARQRAVVTTTLGAEGFTTFEAEPPLAIADDVEAIAETTAALLLDDGRRRELARRGRLFAERHHSPAAWAERLESVYTEARRKHAGSVSEHQYPGSLSSSSESDT